MPTVSCDVPLEPEDLRCVPIFEDLDEDQLGWILAHSLVLELADGEAPWEVGEEASAMFVVLSGEVRMMVEVGGQTMHVSSDRWGGVIGLLPYSRLEAYAVKGRALGTTRLLSIDRKHFQAMLERVPQLGYRLVGLMSDRIREGTRAEQQREKMMALGKLSAGLAHELGNPAAAVHRAAEELARRQGSSNTLVRSLTAHCLEDEQMRAIVHLREGGGGTRRSDLSPLERGEREDAMGEYLEANGVDEPWVLAEAFVEAGLEVEALEQALDGLSEEAVGDALAWVETGLASRQLVGELTAAVRRISELIDAVKSYSHMDRNHDLEETDLHRGLEQTVTILGHRLRKEKVRLIRRYDRGVPRLPLYPSEINQVWTNLLDNAIDAAPEGGKVVVETGHELGWAWVSITDDGPGVDEEVASRIFEPFFTTKPVGEGTGLGLDAVRRAVDLHGGEVELDSEPGRTCFTVRLPLGAGADESS